MSGANAQTRSRAVAASLQKAANGLGETLRAIIQWLLAEAPDSHYADDLVAARHYGAGRAPKLLLITIVAIFLAAIIWASFATVEEVTRGDGRVIPSSKIQVVQSLEGGIVKEILVRPGAVVKRDQLLLRIDDTGFSSSLGEIEARDLALQAQIARLEAEVAGSATITFPSTIAASAPAVIQSEQATFQIRNEQRKSQVAILSEQRTQKEQELNELKGSVDRLTSSLSLAQQELNLNAPLARQGLVPKSDYLRLQREVNDLKGQLDTAERQIPRAEAALREANQRIAEADLTFRRGAQEELTLKQSEFAVLRESRRGAQDRVARTEIRSPVDGVVNNIHVNTLGGVVKPGEDIIEIVPMDDTLLVEARVKPSDIAFIGPGQRALVKLTAYDFSVYGGLEGSVERIGADAIVDAQTGESYYPITIRTRETSLKGRSGDLPIIPGMVASVDIITGEKTILEYLLKPIVRAQHEALRER
ncbi:MAG: HlyD family type I secretion periplasmic adaptor subunit [Alphaproteobacteria bacterium]|nr:HlyD family type I secretion periplasmic adaptor subunit [Alphaproteobacteria bacterium]